MAFCEKLTERERWTGRIGDDKSYQLATEAQWEYACRAGTTTAYYTGDDEDALKEAGWYGGKIGRQTHPVGRKRANAFGLYDMHGNVLEWCRDWFGDYPRVEMTDPKGPATGTWRVLRGGSWISNPRYCRAASRFRDTPGLRFSNGGFRVVLVPLASPGLSE